MNPDQPSRIALRNKGQLLVLSYASGQQFELDAEYLRIASPSAEVQGHGGEGGKLPDGKKNVTITGIEKAGHYALRLHYDDGHDSGIYTWAYFKQLAVEKPQRWQAYLADLQKLGLSRSPDVQVVRMIDPNSIN